MRAHLHDRRKMASANIPDVISSETESLKTLAGSEHFRQLLRAHISDDIHVQRKATQKATVLQGLHENLYLSVAPTLVAEVKVLRLHQQFRKSFGILGYQELLVFTHGEELILHQMTKRRRRQRRAAPRPADIPRRDPRLATMVERTQVKDHLAGLHHVAHRTLEGGPTTFCERLCAKWHSSKQPHPRLLVSVPQLDALQAPGPRHTFQVGQRLLVQAAPVQEHSDIPRMLLVEEGLVMETDPLRQGCPENLQLFTSWVSMLPAEPAVRDGHHWNRNETLAERALQKFSRTPNRGCWQLLTARKHPPGVRQLHEPRTFEKNHFLVEHRNCQCSKISIGVGMLVVVVLCVTMRQRMFCKDRAKKEV
mmetsp:Transcript_9043/g.25254  ORF Transcript_9043/g.25254 Transcript_9043/m.25254 type:complete len:365 (+) Transcript_9043:103-1197(+)